MVKEPIISIKCASCGKFIPYKEMKDGGGAKYFYEPDSEYGHEISEWTCKACTDKGK